MAFIDELLKEKDSLNKRISAINLLLESYGVVDSRGATLDSDTIWGKASQNLTKVGVVLSDTFNFPIHGRKDKQVLWIFKHKAKEGVKISEIQDYYNNLRGLDAKGKEIRIDNVARRLKNEGKLVIVKYNNLNKASFWGLPEWVDNNDFKADYRPDEGKLPIDIHSTEIVAGT